MPPPPENPGDSADGTSEVVAARTDPSRPKSGCRHWFGRGLLILLGGSLGYGGAAYYLARTPKQFTATSSLLIQQQAPPGTAATGSDASVRRDLNTLVERIRRYDLLEKVASRQDVRKTQGLITPVAVDWRPDWLRRGSKAPAPESQPAVPAPAVLAGIMSGWLTVSNRPDTWLIDIKVTHPVPEAAAKLADAVAREYLAECYQERAESNSVAASLYAKASKLARDLDEKEAEWVALLREHPSGHPSLTTKEAEMRALETTFLEEFTGILGERSSRPYWDAIGEQLQNRAGEPDEYLRFARQAVAGWFSSAEWRDNFEDGEEPQPYRTQISSFARVPNRPSAPAPGRALAMGTLGGLLLAMLLAGPRSR
jgi:hypothetical protein